MSAQRIPIFEYYFYPEFVVKPETLQSPKETHKVQFIGMKELEKERSEMQSQTGEEEEKEDNDARSLKDSGDNFEPQTF